MNVKPMAQIQEFLTPIAQEIGVEIIEVKFDARSKTLTVFLDAVGGLDLVKCEAFHRAIDEPLDELDPTFGMPYTLNCSSPGLDRPFKTERDFARHIGEKVEVHLYAAQEGKKIFEGELLSFDGETVLLNVDGKEKGFLFEKTAKVCLYIEV